MCLTAITSAGRGRNSAEQGSPTQALDGSFSLDVYGIKAGRSKEGRTTGFVEAPRPHMHFGKATHRGSTAQRIISIFGVLELRAGRQSRRQRGCPP